MSLCGAILAPLFSVMDRNHFNYVSIFCYPMNSTQQTVVFSKEPINIL